MTLIDVVKSGNFLVLDTETTGLHSNAEICSLAVIDSAGTPLLHTLVKPVRPIPPDATRVHGITDQDVASAPGFAEIAPQLRMLLDGSNVVVYNAVYDRKMLHRSAEAAGLPKIDWKAFSRWYCAMEAFAIVYGEWNEYHGNYRWQRLTTAATYYGLSTEGAHGALADCLMTLGVVQAMAKENVK